MSTGAVLQQSLHSDNLAPASAECNLRLLGIKHLGNEACAHHSRAFFDS